MEEEFLNGCHTMSTRELEMKLNVWEYHGGDQFYNAKDIVAEYDPSLVNNSDKIHTYELCLLRESLQEELLNYCEKNDLDFYNDTSTAIKNHEVAYRNDHGQSMESVESKKVVIGQPKENGLSR